MQRIRRTRPQPVQRIRRPPRQVVDARGSVAVVLEVSFRITDGSVSPTDLREWITDAIERYHIWRSGWVGIDMRGRVSIPEVSIECPDE